MQFKISLFFFITLLFCETTESQVIDTQVGGDVETYLKTAQDYYSARNYKQAIETLDDLIEHSNPESQEDYKLKGYTMLGEIYFSLKEYEKSAETFLRATEIAQTLTNDTLVAETLGGVGRAYLMISNKEKQGILYYKKSTDINTALGLEYKNVNANINLSRAYLKNNMLDEAYPTLLKARQQLREDSLNHKAAVQVLTLSGQYYSEKDQNTLAEDDLLRAVDIALNQGLVAEEEEVQKQLANFYEKQGNFEAAFYHSKRQLQLANELFKNNKEGEIQTAIAQFDLKEYQRELEISKKEEKFKDQLFTSSQKTVSTFVIASIILLFASIIIFYMYRSRKLFINRLKHNNEQLQQAKEEAEKLTKLKTQFFSTISHELRTPLYGVIGIASILLEDEQIKTHRGDLKSLKFSADYLLALINDVLLMSKMESKHIELEYAPFKLSTLLKSITRSFEFSLEQNNNKLHLDIDKNVPDNLIGDSVRLSQILMNLIGNAIKFNEEGNIWVEINTEQVNKEGLYELAFAVRDDGIGIPKESQESIFEEFSQVQQANYNYQGTGLGLPIVRKLLNLYDSDIHLVSKKGEGATFSFKISLEAMDKNISSKANNKIEKQDVNTIIQDAHILIVDDNKINQKITQKILEKQEYICSLASDGEEAVTMAKQSKYDLILMDIHMPKKDGIEATIDIREFDQETPIVALTAVEIEEIRYKIASAGMDDILIKPYDISMFLNVIIRNLLIKRSSTLESSNS